MAGSGFADELGEAFAAAVLLLFGLKYRLFSVTVDAQRTDELETDSHG
ncbi:hypothetical protein [Streptomyces roseochromogenus]|uniref:Uncharacterized protein n=1 Tax=Streptomyces roseochromogenus subsp. oscitans DS 12.976 TaxID=1352936 RepID=V6JG91_STRRC|nr:hypothetical protein [Streptomyces roseochromogenus]EST18927.1 hypothetical protein M878_44230 [Streptomyces roseochromogenus subsp. oscitans DS 12.976]